MHERSRAERDERRVCTIVVRTIRDSASAASLDRAGCSNSRPTCGPDGRLDSRSPVGSRMRMNELLVGYARPSTEQQDLTAQRDGLHALGVVSKAGPRVRKEVPKASSRNQCPRWLGFVAYVLSAVGTDPGPVDDAAPTADAPTTQPQVDIPLPILLMLLPPQSSVLASAAHRDHGLFDRARVWVGRPDS
jgi:hypothetical protein